jgi:hypothetical protein
MARAPAPRRQARTAAFNAGLSATELAAFNTATPNRFAFKHAHSGQNPEKNWGQEHVAAPLSSPITCINEKLRFAGRAGQPLQDRITPSNTIVIASSISNGGGAAIAAAEQDTGGLIRRRGRVRARRRAACQPRRDRTGAVAPPRLPSPARP